MLQTRKKQKKKSTLELEKLVISTHFIHLPFPSGRLTSRFKNHKVSGQENMFYLLGLIWLIVTPAIVSPCRMVWIIGAGPRH